MGLLTSVNNINNSILTDAQQKRKEKQEKELQKIRNSKIEKYFTIYFDNKFKNGDTIENNILYLLQNKSVIIYQLKNEYKAEYKRTWSQSENDYIKSNYFKWINQTKKEYEIINKIQLKKEQEYQKQMVSLEQTERQKYEIIKHFINVIILIFLGIVFFPIIFILALILGFIKTL